MVFSIPRLGLGFLPLLRLHLVFVGTAREAPTIPQDARLLLRLVDWWTTLSRLLILAYLPFCVKCIITVKVLCFDTLLQVLILKELAEPRCGVRPKTGAVRMSACFCRRVRKRLKTKDEKLEKSCKRDKECANI